MFLFTVNNKCKVKSGNVMSAVWVTKRESVGIGISPRLRIVCPGRVLSPEESRRDPESCPPPLGQSNHGERTCQSHRRWSAAYGLTALHMLQERETPHRTLGSVSCGAPWSGAWFFGQAAGRSWHKDQRFLRSPWREGPGPCGSSRSAAQDQSQTLGWNWGVRSYLCDGRLLHPLSAACRALVWFFPNQTETPGAEIGQGWSPDWTSSTGDGWSCAYKIQCKDYDI